jgi:hypothetical protein
MGVEVAAYQTTGMQKLKPDVEASPVERGMSRSGCRRVSSMGL